MNVIRWLLGRLILTWEFLFSPRRPQRSPEEQAHIDAWSRNLVLYQYPACPFCVKVRFAMRRLGLDIELRDPRRNADYREQLLAGGGELKVPCLRIDDGDGATRWLYESSDIIDYLQQRFNAEAASAV